MRYDLNEMVGWPEKVDGARLMTFAKSRMEWKMQGEATLKAIQTFGCRNLL